MGYSEWKPKHNAHHAHTNEVEEDPDVDIPLLSFTEERYVKEKAGIGFYANCHDRIYS